MRIAIIGFGLLGSSIARGLRRARPEAWIQCVEPNPTSRETAMGLEIVDAEAAEIAALADALDIVVMAAPVGAIRSMLPSVIDRLGPETALTDVGSVKAPILAAARAARPAFDRFVPAHPLAGGRRSGPEHGAAEVFVGTQVILTPGPETRDAAVAQVRALFEALGATISEMDAAAHDRAMAYVSHLPRLLAFSAMRGGAAASDGVGRDVRGLATRGFRDLTRAARSDPRMWTDIFEDNAEALRAASAILRAELETFEAAFHDRERTFALIADAADRRAAMEQEESAVAEDGARVGYLGTPGSYSHQASEDLYQDAELIGFRSFAEVVDAVEARELDAGVVPVENSTAGRVAEVYQLLAGMRLHIAAEHFVEIRHCLAARDADGPPPTKVLSHKQALMQCRAWLARHAPAAEQVETGDTAAAAAAVAASDEPGLAAICSQRAAELNGLAIRAADIHDEAGNATRFHVLANAPLAEAPLGGKAATTLIFRVAHRPGALIEALETFRDNGVDMTKLETYMVTHSRNREPTFYVDIAVDRASETGRRTLSELASKTTFLKVLGCYPASALRAKVDGFLVI